MATRKIVNGASFKALELGAAVVKVPIMTNAHIACKYWRARSRKYIAHQPVRFLHATKRLKHIVGDDAGGILIAMPAGTRAHHSGHQEPKERVGGIPAGVLTILHVFSSLADFHRGTPIGQNKLNGFRR